jgi:hypothetical protein
MIAKIEDARYDANAKRFFLLRFARLFLLRFFFLSSFPLSHIIASHDSRFVSSFFSATTYVFVYGYSGGCNSGIVGKLN